MRPLRLPRRARGLPHAVLDGWCAVRRHVQQVTGHGRGSCFATAIACVLDLDLEDVPNVVLFGAGAWVEALALWCDERAIHGRHVYRADLLPAGVPVIAEGVGPRLAPDGKPIRHAVVWLDGAMAHDPHPSGAGLVAPPESWWIFERCPDGGCPECGALITRRQRQLAWTLYSEHATREAS
ncbi:MAG: hypothetical protein KIT58_00125 [Planctomycetota bacterium]|nr:hypothetical protein [Planctomycetota bacterium]